MKLLLKWEKELEKKNKRDIQRVCTIKIQPLTKNIVHMAIRAKHEHLLHK